MLNFVLLRVVNMILNGARGLALAAILGAREYGIFGTLIVLQQYLSYAALGVREGVAIRLARNADGDADTRTIYSSALCWGLGAGSIIVCIFAVLHFGVEKVPLYFVLIGLLSLASIVNEIFININRHEHRLAKVAGMEFVYQGGALLLVGIFWKWMTVRGALLCLLAGLIASLLGYLATLRTVSWRAASWPITKDLIRIGIPAAMFSAVVVVFNSCFVLIANAMKLGDVVGHVVLAANISVMLLFGLNAVSWGLASRTMSRLYLPAGGATTSGATGISDVFFRLGVIGAVLLALCAQPVFNRFMTEYAGSVQFILYFCLFQSYSLLLFGESNFLNVNSRLPPVLGGYLVVMLILAGTLLVDGLAYLAIVRIGVVLHFALALCIAIYAKRIGFSEGTFRERAIALCFPLFCMLADLLVGIPAVIAVCALYLIGNLAVHRERTAVLLGALFNRNLAK